MTQKHFFPAFFFVVCMLAILLTTGNVMADGNKSISRVLDGLYDDFTFKGDHGQILFAEIKAEIYQNKGRMGGDHGDSGGAARMMAPPSPVIQERPTAARMAAPAGAPVMTAPAEGHRIFACRYLMVEETKYAGPDGP